MFWFLIDIALMLLLAICPCRAAEITTLSPRLISSLQVRLSPEIRHYTYSEGLQNYWIDRISLTKLTSRDYENGLGLTHGTLRSLEDKLETTIDPLRQLPGGKDICDAIILGMEFYTFSNDFTTYGFTVYGKHTFYTGYSVKGSNLRTGLFLDF